MGILALNALKLRVAEYPDRLRYAEKMFGNTVETARGLHFDKNIDFTSALATFRRDLRMYEVALDACWHYCQGLRTEIGGDLEIIEVMGSPERGLFNDLYRTLKQEFGAIELLAGRCKEHRQAIHEVHERLNKVAREQDLMDLAIFVEQVKIAQN